MPGKSKVRGSQQKHWLARGGHTLTSMRPRGSKMCVPAFLSSKYVLSLTWIREGRLLLSIRLAVFCARVLYHNNY